MDGLHGPELQARLDAAGYTQREIAEYCQVTPQAVWQWIQHGVPAKRVHQFIRATPRCSFRTVELRPDVFDVAA